MHNAKNNIVENEKYVRELNRIDLQEEGYEVITISRGEGLLKIIEHEEPDLVALDIEMPDPDGLDCLVEIRH